MQLKKFENIIAPIIRTNITSLQPVTISSPSINLTIRKNEKKKDLITFLHGTMCSIVPITWIKEIKNNQFTTWTGLTTDLVTKHLPASIFTAEGHQHQERQKLQSTK